MWPILTRVVGDFMWTYINTFNKLHFFESIYSAHLIKLLKDMTEHLQYAA